MPPPPEPEHVLEEGPADIQLENDRVIVDAPFLILKGQSKEIGSDIDVDNNGRRTEHQNPRRRAIVHDFNDRLTLNYAKDYPGGVRILGDVNVPGKLDAGDLETHNLTVKHAKSPGLTSIHAATAQVTTYNVGEELAALKARITQLEAEVAALKNG